MSATVAPPAIHKWVDGLSPAQVDRLLIVAEHDDVLPSIESSTNSADNSPVEAWLRTTVRATCERIAAGDGKFRSTEEVMEWLESRRPKVA